MMGVAASGLEVDADLGDPLVPHRAHHQVDVGEPDAVADLRLAAQVRRHESGERHRPLRLGHRQIVEIRELADRQLAVEGEGAEVGAVVRGGPFREQLVEHDGLRRRRQDHDRIAGLEAIEVARPHQPAIPDRAEEARVLELQQRGARRAARRGCPARPCRS